MSASPQSLSPQNSISPLIPPIKTDQRQGAGGARWNRPLAAPVDEGLACPLDFKQVGIKEYTLNYRGLNIMPERCHEGSLLHRPPLLGQSPAPLKHGDSSRASRMLRSWLCGRCGPQRICSSIRSGNAHGAAKEGPQFARGKSVTVSLFSFFVRRGGGAVRIKNIRLNFLRLRARCDSVRADATRCALLAMCKGVGATFEHRERRGRAISLCNPIRSKQVFAGTIRCLTLQGQRSNILDQTASDFQYCRQPAGSHYYAP